jgi:NDP-sugar pyrophosphorylase family protein
VTTMDIRGLILVSTGMESTEEPLALPSFPMALLETVGQTPLQRMADRLQQFGIDSVTVVVESEIPVQFSPANARVVESSAREAFWRSAENAFNEMVQDGAEVVVLLHMGSYAEVDFEKLLQFHLDQQARVTQVYYGDEPLQVFCVSSSRRNDAASLFRSHLQKCRSDCAEFAHQGYTNFLKDSRDLRQLAIDILTWQTETRPAGDEIRPGVWLQPRAIIEKGARVLAPAFIGESARIFSGAVITRCSSVEHHAQVDCGTVIENSTVLPYTYVGAGLDVAHCVAGMKTIVNLRRNASIEITDPKLVGLISATPGRALLSSAFELVSYLPRQVWRGLFGKAQAPQPDLQAALRQTPPSLGTVAGYQASACNTDAASEFSPNLGIARRYGHH